MPGFRFLLVWDRNVIVAFWLEFQPRNSRVGTALSTLTRHMDRAGGGRRRGRKLPAAVVRGMGRRRRGGRPNCSRKARPSTLRTQPAASLARGDFSDTWRAGPGRRVQSRSLPAAHVPPAPPQRRPPDGLTLRQVLRENNCEHHPSLQGDPTDLTLPPAEAVAPGLPHHFFPRLRVPTRQSCIQSHTHDLSQMGPKHLQAAPPAMPLNSLKWVDLHGVTLRAKCNRRNHQPMTALGDGVSSSTLSWARKATGEDPTGGEQPSPIKYNWPSAKPKMHATVLKEKKKTYNAYL